MAPYPQDYTGRVWIDYETRDEGIEHTVLLRYPPLYPNGRDEVVQAFAGMLTAFGVSEFSLGWKALRAKHAAAGEDFAFPFALPAFYDTFIGTGPVVNSEREALQMTFIGRGPNSGRRSSIALFGLRSSLAVGNFRYVASTAGAFQTKVAVAVGVLNGASLPLCTIDGDSVVWYPYVNLKYNGYWQRRIRTGA